MSEENIENLEGTAPESVEPEINDQPNESGSSESPDSSAKPDVDVGKLVAAVKKEYREKGHREGYDKGLAEGHQVEPAPAAAPVSASPPVAIDPIWKDKADTIYAEGLAKYPDFEEKFALAAKSAEHNPTLFNIYQQAIRLGDAEAVYDIMTNGDKRARMLDNPASWNKEIFTRSPTKSDNAGVKSPPPPLDKLPNTSVPNKRSREEQRLYVLEKNNFR